jgi:cholest-4-en-3-one 26-monooxygenase
LTAIDNAAVDHFQLSEEEIIYNLLNIVVGGNETTPFTAAAVTYEMLSGDTERYISAYMANRSSFVEEVLRWTTTNAYVQRYALEDTTVGDQKIKHGEFAIMWNYSANRDEKYFTSEFDPERGHPVTHLAFGRGKHRCIGANVATAELLTYLDFLIPHIDRIRPLQAPTILRSNFMRGYTAMPVEIL